jgi:hypothetical protein
MAKKKSVVVLPASNTSNAEKIGSSRVVKRNLVAKFAKSFNKAHCHLDKKAAQKRGKIKHKMKYAGKDFSKGVKLINLLNWVD